MSRQRTKPAIPDFGHSPETIVFWQRLVREALSLSPATPFFIFSARPLAERIGDLDAALGAAGFQTGQSTAALTGAGNTGVAQVSQPAVSPISKSAGCRNCAASAGLETRDTADLEVCATGVSMESPGPTAAGSRPEKITCRHWLSCKTQPVAPLLRWWRQQGRGIEVVSEFELRAALAEGFAVPDILVNGPAKHHWLARHDLPGLAVNFDSPAELAALLPRAVQANWRCGVRLHTGEEFDPENPEFPTQFGFTAAEAVAALRKLRRAKARVETVSFHLRTNVSAVGVYERALAEAAGLCRSARFQPRFLDIGGGLPVRHVLTRGGKVFDGEFGLRAFAERLRLAAKNFPGLREIWLENGRFVSAGGGVLVVKILDVKERRGLRQLICDGGRTLHALTSLWEQHRLLALPARGGAQTLTAVHGPTCMAFDQLARIPLPRALRAGDHLVWLDAGAYHISWETRFSHGHTAVWWHDEAGLRMARPRQSFENFWGQWTEA